MQNDVFDQLFVSMNPKLNLKFPKRKMMKHLPIAALSVSLSSSQHTSVQWAAIVVDDCTRSTHAWKARVSETGSATAPPRGKEYCCNGFLEIIRETPQNGISYTFT